MRRLFGAIVDFAKAEKPGIRPSPTAPPAMAESLRNFLLFVDIQSAPGALRFKSKDKLTRLLKSSKLVRVTQRRSFRPSGNIDPFRPRIGPLNHKIINASR